MTNAELAVLVEQQQDTINHLVRRVSTFNDEVASLSTDVGIFKENVANDMRRIVEMLRNKQ